ncbi:hypothetical protein LNP05_30000 [Klebsiella pneumoniae subsp. pneumoniae]|nr:hypothetical protein [Klebsiella pneumoniae subsp. pneumoniae]
MIKRTGMVVVAVLLRAGCFLPKPQPAHLIRSHLQVKTPQNSGCVDLPRAARRCIASTQLRAGLFLGSLPILTIRNGTHPGRQTGVTKKADVPEDNAPLGLHGGHPAGRPLYSAPSGHFHHDHQICSVMTPWFKPEKGVLYEVRSQLTPDGRQCYVRTWKVDQQNGAVTGDRTAVYPM